MADFADALALELQLKICYHRDAYLSYLELKTMVDELVEEKKKFQDEKLEYQDMINTFIEEKENLQHAYQVMKEKLGPMEEQLETVKKELAAAIEQLAQNNEELEVSRKKLWESEAMRTQLQKQKESAPGPENLHFRRVTRSMQKREMLLQSSPNKTSTRTMYADSRWI